VFLNPALSQALDRIAERASDVRRAFTPGSSPAFDDVAIAKPASQFTLDPLAATAPDGAYFITRDAAGQSAYTRDGSFHVAGGMLACADGSPVLGFSTTGSALGELRVDPIDDALGRALDLRVEADGSFAYTRAAIDPRSGKRELQRVVAGRIALARFPVATKLESANGPSFSAPAGVVPHSGVPGKGVFGVLQPMRREASGIDLDASLARLKAAYVAFDALAAAETAKGRLGKTALDLVK